MKIIKKFKYKDNEVLVEYEETKNDGQSNEKVTFQCDDEPLPELKEALAKLSKHIINICELNNDADIEVTGVSFTWRNEIMGAVLIGMSKLKKSTGVVNLVTPHRIVEFYSEHGDSGQLMGDEMEKDLQILLEHIENYLAGDRSYKQEELFEEST